MCGSGRKCDFTATARRSLATVDYADRRELGSVREPKEEEEEEEEEEEDGKEGKKRVFFKALV